MAYLINQAREIPKTEVHSQIVMTPLLFALLSLVLFVAFSHAAPTIDERLHVLEANVAKQQTRKECVIACQNPWQHDWQNDYENCINKYYPPYSTTLSPTSRY